MVVGSESGQGSPEPLDFFVGKMRVQVSATIKNIGKYTWVPYSEKISCRFDEVLLIVAWVPFICRSNVGIQSKKKVSQPAKQLATTAVAFCLLIRAKTRNERRAVAQ